MDLKTVYFGGFWVQGLSGTEKTIVHITKSTYFDWHYLLEVSEKQTTMPYLSRTYCIPDMIFIALEKQIWYFSHENSFKNAILFQSMAGNTEKKKGEKKKAGMKKKLKILILSLKPSRAVRDYKKTFKTFDQMFCWN